MIKALIIDDEAHIRKDLRDKVLDHFSNDLVIVAEAESVETGLTAIAEHEPDIILLDIQLSDGTGFDLLTQTTFKGFELIFVTGLDNHAIKAIKVGALDYILKPVDVNELKEAIKKAIENTQKDSQLEKLIEISNEYFQGVKKKRVILKTLDNVYAVYEDDILYCKSDGNYTTFYTTQLDRIVISKSIKKVAEILSEDVFIRCHQSYIVNKNHVLKYNKQGVLVVDVDLRVPVSSRRKDYVLKRIFE